MFFYLFLLRRKKTHIMAIVKWYYKTNPGQVFSGDPLSEGDAGFWVRQMNLQFPNLFHWAEKL